MLTGAHNWGEAVPADIEQQVEQIENDVKKDQAEEVTQADNVEGFVFNMLRALRGGKSPFSQLYLILKSFIQATRCFLQIYKIQSNFWRSKSVAATGS